MDEEDRRQIEQQLSPEQLQLFARENQDMLKHYEDTLDQVRYVNWPFNSHFAHPRTSNMLTYIIEQQSALYSKSPSSRPP